VNASDPRGASGAGDQATLLALGVLGALERLERELPPAPNPAARAPDASELAALGAIALLLHARAWLVAGAAPMPPPAAAQRSREPSGWLR
jgi:hypothetical protein